MIASSLSPLLTTMLCPLAISLMAPFLLLVRAESVEEEQGDPYYGVPLGAMHYSAEGTSAEVYAADEFSIIFNHFYHNPREPGCTAMMIGPPRPEDQENVVADHGILLPLAHPPVAARHRLRRRRRRGATALQGYWPVEFGHLLMGPREEEGQRKSAPKTPKEQPRAKAALPGVLNRVNLSEQSTTEQLLLGNGWALDSQSIPTAVTFLPDNGTSTEAEEVMMQSSQQSTEKSITATATLVQQEMANTSASFSKESTMEMSTTSASSDISSDVLSLSGAPASSADSPAAAVSPAPMAQPLILLGGRRSSAAQLQQLKMFGSKEEQQLLLRLEGAELRRAPARHNANSEWGGAKANELDEKGVPPPTLVGTAASTAGPTSSSSSSRTTTTPLFWVIKDPREGRRQRLIELRKKLDPNYEPPTTSTTAAPFSPLEAQFELPRIRDKLATFALTNGAKITQYKWIGLWNQCTKRKIPLVSLRDVDPPTEEKIMPLSGWSHNVTSYRIHVLNCNTILVPSFHYDGRNTTRNTYFFIGVGQFPEAVEHQIKVNVVGQRKGEPLRSYSGEDVLLRLPRPYRTFDIDFISIFNTDEQKSFGHVIIPSLLVPPCPEEE